MSSRSPIITAAVVGRMAATIEAPPENPIAGEDTGC